MSGWPSRILKSELGSTLRDPRTVEHPELEWAARYIELLKHQAVGAALCASRVSLCAAWNTGTSAFDVYQQHEAWNPTGAVAHPVLARTSAGLYTYTFAATYADMDGESVVFAAHGFRVQACGILPTADALPYQAHVELDSEEATPTLVVTMRGADGAPVDAPFWLEVL